VRRVKQFPISKEIAFRYVPRGSQLLETQAMTGSTKKRNVHECTSLYWQAVHP